MCAGGLQIPRLETQAQVRSCELCKTFKKNFFTKHLQMATSVEPSLFTINLIEKRLTFKDNSKYFFQHIQKIQKFYQQ